MLEVLSAGFFLGIGAGVTCAFVCAPIMSTHIALHHPSVRKGLVMSAAYCLGRLLSYGALGVVLGLIGTRIPPLEARNLVYPVATLALGGWLTFYGLTVSAGLKPLMGPLACHVGGRRSGIVLGFLGCTLCIPLLLSLAYSVTLGGPVEGLLFMLAFGVGSAAHMMALGGVSGAFAQFGVRKSGVARVRRVAAYSSVVVGLVLLNNGLASIMPF